MPSPSTDPLTVPPLDHYLEIQLQQVATGEHVHKVQNLLASYKGWHERASTNPTLERLAKFAAAEKEILQFINQCAQRKLADRVRDYTEGTPNGE